MIEIPIWIIFTISIAMLGMGVTICFKVAERKLEISESATSCSIAHYLQSERSRIFLKTASVLKLLVYDLFLKIKVVL